MTPIYNYQYANKFGLTKWIFFGEFVATYYAFAWPYYYNNPPIINDRDSFFNFKKSTDYYTQAVKEFNLFVADTNQTREKKEEIIALYKKVIEHGEKVDIDFLNNRYQSLGDRFRDEFITTIRVQIKYFEDPNTTFELMATTVILNKFWDWLWSTDEIWQKKS